MSYSRLFSLSFRNKHKVKRKPSWDKSGNKHFIDPTRTSPTRKKTIHQEIMISLPNLWAKMYPNFRHLKKKHHPKLIQASFQFCTHWVSCTSQATKNAEIKACFGSPLRREKDNFRKKQQKHSQSLSKTMKRLNQTNQDKLLLRERVRQREESSHLWCTNKKTGSAWRSYWV